MLARPSQAHAAVSLSKSRLSLMLVPTARRWLTTPSCQSTSSTDRTFFLTFSCMRSMLTRTKQAHGKASRDPSTRECTGQSTKRFGRDAQARLPGRRGLGVLHTAFLYRLVCDTKLRAPLSIITYVFLFNFLPTPPYSALSLGFAFLNQLSKCTMISRLGFMSIESCTYSRSLWTIMLRTKPLCLATARI